MRRTVSDKRIPVLRAWSQDTDSCGSNEMRRAERDNGVAKRIGVVVATWMLG